jgi:nitrogen fixation protein NifB
MAIELNSRNSDNFPDLEKQTRSGNISLEEHFSHLEKRHPCFSGEAHVKYGRMHLPVSPACNIQCNFCVRTLNQDENRPGVSQKILTPDEAVDTVKKALELCPEITVVGIAGPGDTLASSTSIETFKKVHERYPELILCLSTNGLRLEEYVERMIAAGVQTISVTVNAVDPKILAQIVGYVSWKGKSYSGEEGAKILIEAQLRGIRKAAASGLLVKCNAVLIPGINEDHIKDIAEAMSEAGAVSLNIIPLIPQGKLEYIPAPSCAALNRARLTAEEYLPVFRHCKHCRADACGIPGKNIELSALLYNQQVENTFSHG